MVSQPQKVVLVPYTTVSKYIKLYILILVYIFPFSSQTILYYILLSIPPYVTIPTLPSLFHPTSIYPPVNFRLFPRCFMLSISCNFILSTNKFPSLSFPHPIISSILWVNNTWYPVACRHTSPMDPYLLVMRPVWWHCVPILRTSL